MSLKFSYIPYKINKIIVLIYLPKQYRKYTRDIVLIYVFTLI